MEYVVAELVERACERISVCEYILRESSTFKKKKRTVDQKHLVSAKEM